MATFAEFVTMGRDLEFQDHIMGKDGSVFLVWTQKWVEHGKMIELDGYWFRDEFSDECEPKSLTVGRNEALRVIRAV